MRNKSIATALLIAACLCFAVAALSPAYGTAAIALAFVLLIVASSLIGKLAALGKQLAPFVGRQVQVRVWRNPVLPVEHSLKVDSVRVLGAGLHIFLSAASGGRSDLKIAQPAIPTITTESVEIAQAAYVSLDGKKFARSESQQTSAVTMTLT